MNSADPAPLLARVQAARDRGAARREELAAARTLGYIQIKPRLGMQVQPFDFGAAATLSILYALGLDRDHFH
ncbi:MAG: hypothetical protein RQ748_10570, partial [Elusimicrobiales bacterium]|nr:hypothetical protein [Elusimicrobiales bacterium]